MVPEEVWDWHFCSYRCVFFVLFFVSPCLVLSVASWGSVSLAVFFFIVRMEISLFLWKIFFLWTHVQMDSIAVRSGWTYGETAVSASTHTPGTQPGLDDYLLPWFKPWIIRLEEHMDPAWRSRGVLAARLAAKSCREVGVEKRNVGAGCVISSRSWLQPWTSAGNSIRTHGNPGLQVSYSALAACDLLSCRVIGVHCTHTPSNP
jgi:hypothetical protein